MNMRGSYVCYDESAKIRQFLLNSAPESFQLKCASINFKEVSQENDVTNSNICEICMYFFQSVWSNLHCELQHSHCHNTSNIKKYFRIYPFRLHICIRKERRQKNHKYPVINLHHRFQSQKVKSTENQFRIIRMFERRKHIRLRAYVYTIHSHSKTHCNCWWNIVSFLFSVHSIRMLYVSNAVRNE